MDSDLQNNPFYIGPGANRGVQFSPLMLSGYPQRQSQPQVAPAQSGGGINPISAYNTATQFGMPDYLGIGSSSAASAPTTGAIGGASTGAEIGPASLAVGGEGGAGSLMASVGPWAALVAAIIANESWAKKEGRRPDDIDKHLLEMVTGKGLETDLNALGDNIGGPFGKGVSFMGKLGSPHGMYNLAEESVKKPVEWVSKLLGGLF